MNSKLFDKWDISDINISDLGIKQYICLKNTSIPHTSGKHARKQFNKSYITIVERLINNMMRKGKNTGKKQMAMNIVKESFSIINNKTKKNPIQVLVDAISYSGPREEVVRLKYGGISVPKAVDTAPQRRVDTALRYISTGALQASFKSKRTVSECLASELLSASVGDSKSFSVSKKDAKERVAKAAR